jgi:hypothetical protein
LPIEFKLANMKFSSAFFVVLSSFVVAGFASSPAQVKGDVTETLARVNNFDKDITKFPAEGATEAQFSVCQLIISYALSLTLTLGYSKG